MYDELFLQRGGGGGETALQVFKDDENALYNAQWILLSNTECKHNFGLFTIKLHREP